MKRSSLTAKHAREQRARVFRELLTLRRAAVVHTNRVDAASDNDLLAGAHTDASLAELEECAFRYANALAPRERRRLS